MSKRPRCCSIVQRATANSSRKRPNGEHRFFDGDRCLNKASFIDREGDGWCWLHAQDERMQEEYGPFTRIGKP